MGAYCIRALIPRHTAQVGEVVKVVWSDYYGAAKFGDGQEIACLTLGVGLRSREQPSYTHSFLLGDRFELPGGTRVGPRHLVGLKLKLQLIPYLMYPIPTEGDLVERKGRDLANSVTV